MKIQTAQGPVTLSDDSLTVPFKNLSDMLKNRSVGRKIPLAEIHSVSVGGNDKKYMTANRAAGALLTGGIALLAPTKVRGQMTIGLVSGEVLTFKLGRKEARNPESVAMAFSVAGVEVV